MTAERRLTSEQLVGELRIALDLPANAGLKTVVERLLAFASAPEVPAALASVLQRAAEAADMALVTEGAAHYHHLGTAYAYLTQAQGLVGRDGQ